MLIFSWRSFEVCNSTAYSSYLYNVQYCLYFVSVILAVYFILQKSLNYNFCNCTGAPPPGFYPGGAPQYPGGAPQYPGGPGYPGAAPYPGVPGYPPGASYPGAAAYGAQTYGNAGQGAMPSGYSQYGEAPSTGAFSFSDKTIRLGFIRYVKRDR